MGTWPTWGRSHLPGGAPVQGLARFVCFVTILGLSLY